MKHGLRWGVGLCGAVLMAACLPLLPSAGRADPEGKALRVLATHKLPPGRSAATDIRWTGDDSFVVTRLLDGVREFHLGEKLVPGRVMVPAVEKFGNFHSYARLAGTDRLLVVAAESFGIAWRPLAPAKDGNTIFEQRPIGLADDIDVMGDRLLVLGTAYPEMPRNEGGIVWLATLSSRLTDWRPLLQDAAGTAQTTAGNFGAIPLGGARFLPDGSFIVVPGFQPGVFLFSPEGKILRTWTNQEVGLTTDLTQATDAFTRRFHADVATRRRWMAQQRLLDDILLLPEGPALLIRSTRPDGQVHWELKVLGPRGISVYPVPFTGEGDDRLHGDVRNGKVIFLRAAHYVPNRNLDESAALILAKLPGHQPVRKGEAP